jgi:hypothetical protein
MKTRISSIKLLAMTVTLAVIAAIWAVWGATPAKAIIIVNKETGMFTVTQGEAVRIHVVNTDQLLIIDDGKLVGKIADSEGNTLMEFRGHRLRPGQAESFVWLPPDPIQPMAVRVELMVEGVSSRQGGTAFIPTCEVFDTGTGKTDYGIYAFNPQPEPPIPL